MIESPVKPAPSNGRAAPPPPNPAARVMDPPPDAGLVHDRACAECGSPLHADQSACLSCGSMVEETDGRMGIRRAALSSATALLLLGIAVGAAVAGLPNGKHIGKSPPIVQALGNKPIPPATAGTPHTTKPTTPLPAATAKAKTPPPIHSSSSSPKSSSTSTSSGTSSSGGSNPSGGSNGTKKKGHKGGGKKGTHHHGHKGPTLFALGAQPGAASFFRGQSKDHPNLVYRTIDGDASTAWTTGSHPNGLTKDPGIAVQPPPSPPYTGIGLVSSTPGYGVEVLYTTASTPPSGLGDWTHATSTSSASAKQRLSLTGAARNATWYLVLITDLAGRRSVSLTEIQVFE